jgi:poly-gamma-glutamate synthase PgsB/CapB
MGIELLAAATAGVVGLGLLEALSHRRKLRQIPVRVHVSGTRGKSSVTRLVAAGLRASGLPTAAKTTGTLPRMILPDGKEVPVFRPAGANIIEQIRIVSAARAMGAQALILECMALQPELHWLSERWFVKATHGVITNARPDHLEVMGPTSVDVARALAGMIPVGGVLFTAEREHLSILREAAEDRGTRLEALSDADLEAVSDEELGRFAHLEHRENVALALRVLADLDVARDRALEGMWTASPDPGALTEHEVDFFGRRIIFVNGFAANDPLSTETIWRMTRARHPGTDRVIAIFNLRSDRPHRTLQLAREARFWHEADHVVLMGSGAYHFARDAARYADFDPGRFVFAEHQRLEEIFEVIVGLCGRTTLVVGMANIYGQGLALVKYFRNREILPPGPETKGAA